MDMLNAIRDNEIQDKIKKFALDKDDNLVDDQGYFISKENARTN